MTDPEIIRIREDNKCYIENDLQYTDPSMYEFIKNKQAGGQEKRLASQRKHAVDLAEIKEKEERKQAEENRKAEELYNNIIQPFDMVQEICEKHNKKREKK